MNMKKIACGLCLLFVLSTLWAQELQVTGTQVPQQIRFAQPFTLQVQLHHPQNAVPQTDPEAFAKEFEVTDVSTEQQSPTDTLYRITAVPFTLNKSTFTITFSAQNGTPQPLELTKEIPLNVEKVNVFEDKKFRDIRGMKFPFNWWLLLLVLLVMALIIGAVIYANRSKAAGKKISPSGVQDNRPANVIALAKLDALVNSGLWESHQYKVFYLTMSDILREYLWRMFNLDVSADTSAELLRRIKNLPPFSPLVTDLRNLLNSSDLVKFAQFIPSLQTRNKDIILLRDIIKKTAPKPEIPAQEKPQ